MPWRTALGVLFGVLLPLPLLLLLGGVLHPGLWSQNTQGARLSPMLDIEERTRRLTYHRECARNADCDPPLGCLNDTRVGRRYCTDSKCTVDTQCPDSQVCRGLPTMERGLLVRFCVPFGVRREGEQCVDLPRDQGAACEPGLLCGGRQGWCARPCRKEEATSCPKGFFCADVDPQPVCLPTCEEQGCPEGQQCIRYAEGSSACAVVYGTQCQQSPCSGGRECLVLAASRHPGKAWMECVNECGEGSPPCPEGLVCNRWHCLPPCNPEEPGACAEGYRCDREGANDPWVCLPDR